MVLAQALLDPSLAAAASQVWEADGATISVGGIAKTLRVSRPDPLLDLARYTGWGVQTRDNAESKIRPIVFKDGSSRTTIGFVFPIGSFDPASDYAAEKLDDPYQRVYASAAASLIVEQGIANECVRRDFESLPDESNLADIFAQDCAIVVLAVRIASRVGVDIPYVKLALQEYGYFASAPQEKFAFRPYVSSEPGHRKVSPPSRDVQPFISEISEIVSIAAKQASPVTAFIVYYQVIELLSHERFRSEVSRIAGDPACRADAWLLKEKLAEAASERKRINALVASCNLGGASVIADVDRVSKAILASMSYENLDKMSAADALYKVRNVLVHDQKAVPRAAYVDLLSLVDAMHLLVFALVRGFDVNFGNSVIPTHGALTQPHPVAQSDPQVLPAQTFVQRLAGILASVVGRLVDAIRLSKGRRP